MSRVYNFSAGPSVLPEEVLREDRLSDHIYLYSRESGRLSAPGGDSVLIPAR